MLRTARARNKKTLFAVKLDYLQAKLKNIENEERRKAEAHKYEERRKAERHEKKMELLLLNLEKEKKNLNYVMYRL
ncbi:hypothetical protein ABEB36_014962 [Hypothenemus hampei]|uniref:Uncharacterized protein n=1 Tax=Hypothenemus hampei TaxID=57062 RepID=A0ABD1E1F0_HYPHA